VYDPQREILRMQAKFVSTKNALTVYQKKELRQIAVWLALKHCLLLSLMH
jgi:hypothetical protein